MSKEQKTSNKPLSTALIKLMVGQGVSMIGDSFTGLALMWFIVQTGSPMQVGINLALAFIPSVVFAPFMGSIVDRISRKKLLISSDVLRFFLDGALIFFISIGWFSIYLIYLYSFLKAVVRLVYTPAQRAVIQQLTIPDQRIKANALQSLSAQIAMVSGPVLAGLAVKHLAMHWAIAIDAATFLISAIIIYCINIDESHIIKSNQKQSYWQQMHQGLVYVAKNRWIILLSFAYAFVNGGNALYGIARPYLIKDLLGLGADALGLLTSLGSLGAILTSAALMRIKLKGHKLNYVMIATVIWGGGVVLVSQATSFVIAATILFIAFSMGPVMGICNNVFYQNQIPSEFMGRVHAVRSFVSSLAMPVGFLFGASVINRFGISGSFVVSGTVILFGTIFVYAAKQLHGKIQHTAISSKDV